MVAIAASVRKPLHLRCFTLLVVHLVFAFAVFDCYSSQFKHSVSLSTGID